MMDRLNATMVDEAAAQGCRTLCQHPGCGKPIFERRTGPTWYWVHVDPDFDREHPAMQRLHLLERGWSKSGNDNSWWSPVYGGPHTRAQAVRIALAEESK